jgi:preprotein translocase subunit SecD
LGAAIDLGFKRAFTAILDSNVTTILAGAVLIIFGTGAIRGFGVTLCLGVFLSFFTAITASRIMLQAVANLDIAKNHWLYGA